MTISTVWDNTIQQTKSHIELAVEKAAEAREKWSKTSWEHRAAIFLKAAELLAGPLQVQNECRHHDRSIKKCDAGRDRCSL